MNTEYFQKLPTEVREAITEAFDNDSAEEIIDSTKLKLEINEIVWRNAASKTTLEKAEQIATTFWQAILETHDE